jgi:hypothetical protein
LDIDKLVSSSDDEGLEKARRAKKAGDKQKAQEGLVSGLVQEQKCVEEKRAQEEAKPKTMDQMLDSLTEETKPA